MGSFIFGKCLLLHNIVKIFIFFQNNLLYVNRYLRLLKGGLKKTLYSLPVFLSNYWQFLQHTESTDEPFAVNYQ